MQDNLLVNTRGALTLTIESKLQPGTRQMNDLSRGWHSNVRSSPASFSVKVHGLTKIGLDYILLKIALDSYRISSKFF